MPVVNIPLHQGFYVSESLPISAQECINLYPSIPETSTITQANVFGTPGVEQLVDVGDAFVNRGMWVFNEQPYFVNGNLLYRLNYSVDAFGVESWSLTILGIIPGSSRVSMADNGLELCIVAPDQPGFNAWILDTSDVFTQISDPGFDGPVSNVSYKDGYFVFLKKDSNKFFSSDLRDGLSYDASFFENANADPDPNVATASYRNQLLVLGSETLSGWQNIGGADFPFEFAGIQEQKGCFAPDTVIESDGVLYWVGGTRREKAQILAYTGGRPEPISTRAIEKVISKYTRAQLAESYSWDYSEDGAQFIGFAFPDETFVFDLSTKLWHTRQSTDDAGNQVAWRSSGIIEGYSFLLTADRLSGKIGRVSRDVLSEYGTDIQRTVVLPPVDNNGSLLMFNRFELVAETGEAESDDDEAIVRLSWSDNGGRSFSDEEQDTLGADGEYTKRAYWNGLGYADRSRMFKIETSSRVKIAFIKTEVDIDG